MMSPELGKSGPAVNASVFRAVGVAPMLASEIGPLSKNGSVAEFVGDKTQGGGLTAPQRGRRGHSQRLRQSGLGFPWVGVAKGGPGQNRTLCLPGPINRCPA